MGRLPRLHTCFQLFSEVVKLAQTRVQTKVGFRVLQCGVSFVRLSPSHWPSSSVYLPVPPRDAGSVAGSGDAGGRVGRGRGAAGAGRGLAEVIVHAGRGAL